MSLEVFTMESTAWIVLDGLLITALLTLGGASLLSKDLRRAVVLFIAFGLLLALVWVRLRAPDIALAEAAIGAGLSGALLLAALRDEPPSTGEATVNASTNGWSSIALSVLCVVLALGLGWAFVVGLSSDVAMPLADQVFAQLDRSGVSNPVTAVLLNFRAYDTLLELAVLLTALLGLLALGAGRPGYAPSGLALSTLARWLAPIIILTSGYLLWAGAHAPGGAFQAGALLASAGVLLRLSGQDRGGLPGEAGFRILSVAGVAVFLAVGLLLMLAGRPFLGYPPAWAGHLILAVETAATLAIAATLAAAYFSGKPRHWISQSGHENSRHAH